MTCLYRIEQDAPKGSDYSETFFEVIAKNQNAAYKKACEIADYKILKVTFIRVLF